MPGGIYRKHSWKLDWSSRWPATKGATAGIRAVLIGLPSSKGFLKSSGPVFAERSLFAEHVVVMLGEAVRLVACVLEKP